MADLDVQPKRSSPWWLWLFILLIVAAVLYFVFHGHAGQAVTSGSDSAKTTEQRK